MPMEIYMELPADVEHIIGRLERAGFEAYAVGGCVRDALLGKTPGDWDIATSARPSQVKQVFGRTIDTGIQHGTVTVMRNHVGYEITTFRIDGDYKDGRHPSQVAYTPDLLEDLKRRDFTINAMAYNHRSGMIDAFDGIGDLKKHIIRCVGDPMERFGEDALRMLRAVRFAGQLGFEVEPKTREAVLAVGPNLAQVSRERVQIELTKLLLSDRPDKIRMVYELGLAPYISGAFQKLPWEDIYVPADLKAEKALRWSAFLSIGSSDQAAGVLKDLKMDNDTISRVRLLTEWWNKPIPADAAGIRRVMSRMPAELYLDLLELKRALAGRPDRMTQDAGQIRGITDTSLRILEAGDCLYLKQLAVKGQDLIAAGKKPGRELGEALNGLLELVLEHPEWNTRECLLEKLK